MKPTQRKPVRLTMEQANVLVNLHRSGAQTPFELRASIATLYELADNGYVDGPRVNRREARHQPHHRLRWGIRDKGDLVARAILQQAGKRA